MSRRFDSTLTLLLKYMQYVNRLSEPNGVHRPIGVAGMIFDDLQNTRALKPLDAALRMDAYHPPA